MPHHLPLLCHWYDTNTKRLPLADDLRPVGAIDRHRPDGFAVKMKKK
ncbi:hypothetical protein OOK60_10860 [Trichothermofontia sichuanensis B231]|nr:hypothetical protein [Trichothermofontia sichuanensis]UZQ53020.1 hypothetical protein OOK60_10860 [Trichothermofontia sichuanensis B231]